MEITLLFPIKSYLKKYLSVSFGEDIKLTERNWFGVLVLNILKRKTFKNPNYDHKTNIDFGDRIILRLDLGQAYRNGTVILDQQKYFLNRALDQIFKDELIKHALINQHKYKIDFKTSIINILAVYAISEEELAYETIRKYFNRNYKKIESNMIL